MRALVLLAGLAATPALATEVEMPSGLRADLFDVILETDDARARFRFHTPGIGAEPFSYAAVEADFPWVCETVALPALEANMWSAEEIVISFSAEPIEFGASVDGVLQFFEIFSVEGETCILELF